mmetsp:Transcript_22180/g.61434  ORF Transcript_22180/g.61434 Transcript_22180/m.61434 type:complete len:203 (+) Transcript_22180:697-1305(+)
MALARRYVSTTSKAPGDASRKTAPLSSCLRLHSQRPLNMAAKAESRSWQSVERRVRKTVPPALIFTTSSRGLLSSPMTRFSSSHAACSEWTDARSFSMSLRSASSSCMASSASRRSRCAAQIACRASSSLSAPACSLSSSCRLSESRAPYASLTRCSSASTRPCSDSAASDKLLMAALQAPGMDGLNGLCGQGIPPCLSQIA